MSADTAAPRDERPRRWVSALIVGQLTGLGLAELSGVPLPDVAPPVAGLVLAGLLCGPPRWRQLGWLVPSTVVLVLLLVMYTPLAGRWAAAWVVDEPPGPADVIVVLSAGVRDGLLSVNSQARWLHGLRLTHAGYAPRLVCTGSDDQRNDFHRRARQEAAAVGLPTDVFADFEVPPHSGILNTHGEAVGVAAMARARGWREILLVTSPTHTRRARAAFRAAGLDPRVVSAPSVALDGSVAAQRRRLFRALTGEWLALWRYRLRGWA